MHVIQNVKYVLPSVLSLVAIVTLSCGILPLSPENDEGAVVITLTVRDPSNVSSSPSDPEDSNEAVQTLAEMLVYISEAVVVVTGPDMDRIEQRLLINQSERKAYGTITGVPVGDNRKVRIELKNSLSQVVYYGDTVVNVQKDRTTEAKISLVSTYEKMIYIPSAEFIMGSDTGDADESPMRRVYVNPFWIDETEVTNLQYASYLNEALAAGEVQVSDVSVFMGNNILLDLADDDCQIVYSDGAFVPDGSFEDNPAVCVTWFGATAFAEHYGKRLPTEAEWERAARGTDGRKYPWGDTTATSSHCNFGRNVGQSTPVGQYSPLGDSPDGCSDMAGNVGEWCADWYDGNYYATGPTENPQGPSSGSYKILRGGSWRSDSTNVRCANRDYDSPSNSNKYTGFRCAR